MAHEIAVIFLTVQCIFKSLGGACHFSRQTRWYVLCCLPQICLCCCFVAFISNTHYASPSKDKQTTLVAKLRLSNKCHAAPMSGPPHGFLGNLNPSGVKQTYRDHEGWYTAHWPSTTTEEPVQHGSRPQSSQWCLFPEASVQTSPFPFLSDLCNTHFAPMSLQRI